MLRIGIAESRGRQVLKSEKPPRCFPAQPPGGLSPALPPPPHAPALADSARGMWRRLCVPRGLTCSLPSLLSLLKSVQIFCPFLLGCVSSYWETLRALSRSGWQLFARRPCGSPGRLAPLGCASRRAESSIWMKSVFTSVLCILLLVSCLGCFCLTQSWFLSRFLLNCLYLQLSIQVCDSS